MSAKWHPHLLLVLGVVLALWGALFFFEDTYFGANFYNVPVPSWAAWVGTLPIWAFNVLDSIFVAILFTAIILGYYATHRRRKSNSRGGAGVVLIALLLAVLVIWTLFSVFGITLGSLVDGLRSFFGISLSAFIGGAHAALRG